MSRKFLAVVFTGLVIAMNEPVKETRLSKLNHREVQVSFPFEVVSRHKQRPVNTTIWTLRVLLDRAYYSKENLDALFRLLSSELSDRKDAVYITVHCTMDDLKREQNNAHRANSRIYANEFEPREASIPNGQTRNHPYDAAFFRQGPGAGGVQANEWYLYRPHPDTTTLKVVVLRGVDPSAEREPLKSLQKIEHGIRVKVDAYTLKDVDPPGTYLTMYTFTGGILEWQVVMSLKKPDQQPITEDNIKIVNVERAYVFFGCLYAATSNGGRGWTVWDAEDHIPDLQCLESDFIKSVEVTADGNGVMIMRTSAMAPRDLTLRSNNYGQTWTVVDR